MKIVLNGASRDIQPSSTIASLLKELKVNPEQVAVEINLQIIDRAEFLHTPLQDGDRVEVISFVGGG